MAARHRLPAELEEAQARLTAIYEAREADRRWYALVPLLRERVPAVEPPRAKVERVNAMGIPEGDNVINFSERARRRRENGRPRR